LKKFREETLKKIKVKFVELFNDDLSKPIKDHTVDIKMKENAKPFVHKPYTVPFHIRDKVIKELEKLEKNQILERVESAEWASPMVVVSKPNKTIRICMD
jgi:hypothetical protein